MVTIDSAAENQWVVDTFYSAVYSNEFSQGTPGFWIGYNDMGGTGVYYWQYGSSVYTNWDPAASVYSPFCATLTHSYSSAGRYLWYPSSCSELTVGLCEINLISPTPAPTMRPTASRCTDSDVYFDSHCYSITTSSYYSFFDAENACTAAGDGRAIVTITSAEENQFLTTNVLTSGGFWIGYKRKAYSSWVWEYGFSVYTN